MSQWSDSVTSTSERDQLSALMDGELDESEIQRACAQWRDEADSRARWHAYHLIGDVLRSDELAGDSRGDLAFLVSLRERLAAEPVVLAPQALPVSDRSRTSVRRARAWIGSAAVAAGFAAVIGVVAVTQATDPGTGDGLLVQGTTAVPVATLANTSGDIRAVSASAAAASLSSAEPPAVILNGRLIRDARLDEYLAAHKKFGGSSAPGAPSGFLRNASADAPGR